MKLSRILILLPALLSFTGAVRADNESMASIITNTATARAAGLSAPRRTSIIYIACHGLGLGDLSCYGQTNFQTPNLDRLAAEGMRFTDCRAAGDDLSQAQAALMTGSNASYSPSQITLAARLQQLGYHTGLIGEWTLGAQPWTQGFDEFAGFLNEQEARNYYSDFYWRYAPKSHYDAATHTLTTWVGKGEIYENTGGMKGKYLPDLLLKAATSFVRDNEPDFANHYRPFFLLVSLPAPESTTPGQDDYTVPTDAPFTGESWPQAAKNRAALIGRLDAGVGSLLEQLGKLRMTNNVAIFFTGAVAPEGFADTNLDFLKLKGEVRGGSSKDRLRVPMMVRWPENVPAGRVSRAPWSPPDFAPTVMEIAQGKPAPGFAGLSILPVLLDQNGTNAPDVPDMPGRSGGGRQF